MDYLLLGVTSSVLQNSKTAEFCRGDRDTEQRRGTREGEGKTSSLNTIFKLYKNS